jgi:hypothetical protein
MSDAAVAAAARSTPAKTSLINSRLIVLALGMLFVLACRTVLSAWVPVRAGDFDLLYASAVRLLRGDSIYPGEGHGLLYPLPAVVFAAPFTAVSLALARLIFDVLSGYAFVYALWKYRGEYAVLALFSGSYLYALVYGQLTPLMVGASLFSVLGCLLAVRPNTGLALFAARPSWIALIGMAGFFVLSLVLVPSWPGDWWRALPVDDSPWVPAILRPFGALLLLGALRWNQPEGRLLLATALLPQTTLPYELVPLALIPANRRQMLVYLVGSWISVAAATGVLKLPGGAQWLAGGWPVTLCAGYLPMLYLVLRRPGAKGGPWIGPERRRPHRIPDQELQVVAAEGDAGRVSVTVTHLPSQKSMTQSAPTREMAIRRAHDQLAALLARTFRLVKKNGTEPK